MNPASPGTAVAPHPPSRLRAALLLAVILELLGFGMILPLLPFYAQRFGVTEVAVGWLFAAYSLAQLVVSPLMGRLSDRLGRRPVILGTIVLSVGANLLFALAGSFGLLVAARALSGVAASNLGIAQAYLADVTPRHERSKAMGMIGAAFGIGFVLGPAFGVALSLWSEVAVPLGAAALSALNLVFAITWLREPPRERGATTSHRWLELSSLGRTLAQGPVAGLLLLSFLITFCFAQMEATIVLYCQQVFGFDRVHAGLMFAALGVLMALVQGGMVGPLTRRFGDARLLATGILLIAAGLLLLPAARPPLLAALVVAGCLLAVGAGLHNASSLGLLSQLAGDDEQGQTFGWSRSFAALARVLGPLLGTWSFRHLGKTWPFWIAGTLALAGLAWSGALLRRLGTARRSEVAAASEPA